MNWFMVTNAGQACSRGLKPAFVSAGVERGLKPATTCLPMDLVTT
jgi:hypothetical protein